MLGWLKRIARRFAASTTSKPASWFIDWIHQERENESGVSVDGQTALRYAPVWNAVNRICGRLAQLPLIVYEQTGPRTNVRAVKHPAYGLLRRRPNPSMTPATFKEVLTYHAIMWGNGRAAIVRNGRGDPLELVPLLPESTKTVVVNGAKWHTTEVTLETGEVRTYKFRDADVLHVIGLGYDGIQGYALYELAKTSWGCGIAAEKSEARLFKNHTVPGLILEAPAGLFANDEEAKKFLQAFRDMHEGMDNAGKTALLREGIKATKLALTGDEAQAVEQRTFQQVQAGLWFLIESMLGIENSVSYNSLEQKQLAELINCLNPWLVKWQEQCEAKLLREREIAADSHFFRWSTGALLRSDTKTTYETLAAGVRGRIITPNEAREVLDLEPIAGGDELQNPAIDVRKSGPPGSGEEEESGPPGSGGEEDSGPPGSGGKEEKSEDRRGPADHSERLRATIADRLQELAAVEIRRVEAAAAKPNAGLAIREFYGRWEDTLAKSLIPMVPASGDVDRELTAAQTARAWCQESLRLLAGEPLASLTVTSTWPERAARLAESLV
jgi:HK97 family phage portal protein